MRKLIALVLFVQLAKAQKSESFSSLCESFKQGFDKLNIAQTDLDYQVNFSAIPDLASLEIQNVFFNSFAEKVKSYNTKNAEEQLRLSQLRYEIVINQERIQLEHSWILAGRLMPSGGLSSEKDWYKHYVKRFTSVDINPESVHEYGKTEVARIHREMDSIRNKLGFRNDSLFYRHLADDSFYLTDPQEILLAYQSIDQMVRNKLATDFSSERVPQVGVMQWPNAGPSTPPGIYLSEEDNPYGKPVFQYNFYGGKHNKRCMEWLYMHEAIPGHHLQSVYRAKTISCALSNMFFYFGNAEGWACYVEDCGRDVGLYSSDYLYLGKLEWDLVRSARLVIETGIHYYGWTTEEAMKYWKENIKGQDEIAQREITRVTNWPGQALCYKIGAKTIREIASRFPDKKKAHEFLLTHSDMPLQVLLNSK